MTRDDDPSDRASTDDDDEGEHDDPLPSRRSSDIDLRALRGHVDDETPKPVPTPTPHPADALLAKHSPMPPLSAKPPEISLARRSPAPDGRLRTPDIASRRTPQPDSRRTPSPDSDPLPSSVPGLQRDGPMSLAGRRFHRLAAIQYRYPGRVLLLTAILTLAAVLMATRLEILTGFEYLLPQDRKSVGELHRVGDHTSGVSNLFVVLEAPGQGPPLSEPLRRLGDKLTEELRALGEPWIGSADDGVHDAVRYLEPRVGLYAELPDLEKLRADIDQRYEYEVQKAADLLLEDEPPPVEIDAERLRQRFGVKDQGKERYPGGYFESADGRALVIAMRSKILATDLDKGNEALRRVREIVERAAPASYDPNIRWGFAGDLYSGTVEVAAIHEDLTDVGLVGLGLITGIVLLYYLRARTVVLMLLSISIGVVWTFGLTEALIGHLNIATGFLFTIIAGNGINFAIIYMARYLEARRKGAGLEASLAVAHRETWLATLCACSAAAASYGSLVATEFRGFRDFGVIGGAGMLLCWLATYLALPPMLVLVERVAPIDTHRKGLVGRLRSFWEASFGKPFAALVRLAPRTIFVVGVASTIAGFTGLYFYIARDPMDYNVENLRNDRGSRSEEEHFKKLADDITGFVGADGMAILVERTDQVAPLREALYAKRDAATPDEKPFEALHALEDFVPEDQQAKIPILLAIKQKLQKIHGFKGISDADWHELERYLPPDDLGPVTLASLPEGVARTFTESDGTRGRIVYISPAKIAPTEEEQRLHGWSAAPRERTEDARYLLRWADSYRETALPDGSVVLGSGRAVIYADMFEAVRQAVPFAVLLSFLATVIVVCIYFRFRRAALLVLGSLLVGIGWLVGLFVLFDIKVNFLNFIALPITFGIGVDYAVNIVHRYTRQGSRGALDAVRETGGAVVLCSLTTILGYLALIKSINFAVRSLGTAAVLGEVCCILAAVLVLPAGLEWLARRRRARRIAELSAGRPALARD